MRKRQARADRLTRILAAMDSAYATELRETAHGWITVASQAMEVSKATASRDFALVRRIHRSSCECLDATSIQKEIGLNGLGTGITMGLSRLRVGEHDFRNEWATFRLILAAEKRNCLIRVLIKRRGKNTDYLSQLSTRDLIRVLGWSVRRMSR